MTNSHEIYQLRERIRNIIENEDLPRLLDTLALQANSALQRNESQNLNSLDFAILKLMMIDHLTNNFNIRIR